MKKLIILFLLIAGVCYSQLEIGKQLGWKWGLKKSAIYQFALDFDGSTEYLSTTPALRLTGEYSLYDNFSDGNYDGWTVSSGAYSVVDSVPLSGGTKSLKCTTAGIISIPCNQAYGSWEFDWYKGADGNSYNMGFIVPSNVDYYTNGYSLIGYSSTALRVFKNGSTIVGTNTGYVMGVTWYRLKVTRNTNGSFTLYIKGGTFGSDYVLVSVTGGSGTNPVTDNTYTSSNYFVLDLDANDMISNIVCQQGEGSLDLNSYERIYHSDNRNMTKTGGFAWANGGTHTIDTTSSDKRTGSYSGKLISTASGDSATNFISLPNASFDTLKTDSAGVYEKYTLEGWARGTGVLGSAVYTSDFSAGVDGVTDVYNTASTGNRDAISDGTTSYDNTLAIVLNGNSAGVSRSYRSVTITSGTTYNVNIVWRAKTSQTFRMYFGDVDQSLGSLTAQSTWTTTSVTALANSTYTKLTFALVGTPVIGDSLCIASIVVSEVTTPTLNIRIGSQLKSITGISCVPATFTKFVFNFQSNALVSNQDVKVWLNQADTVYIDDVSLTKSYDVLINAFAKTNTASKELLAFSSFANYDLYVTSGGGIQLSLTSSTTNNANSSVNGFTGTVYKLASGSCNRIGNITTYLNGTGGTPASIINVGKVNSSATFYISYTTPYFFNGQIGHVQIVKFTDISQSTVNATNLTTVYDRGYLKSGEWTGGTPKEVLFLNWSGGDATEMLRDKSGTGNNLTGTNIDITDRVKVKGKFK